MRNTKSLRLALCLSLIVAGPTAAKTGRITTVLLASKVIPDNAGSIVISADGRGENRTEACFEFDLRPIPYWGAKEVEFELQLVAETRRNRQTLKIFEAASGSGCSSSQVEAPIGGWIKAPDLDEPLHSRIDAKWPRGTLKLFLTSISRNTHWEYLGKDAEPSKRPRLIVSYTLSEAPATGSRSSLTSYEFDPPFKHVVSGPVRYKDSVLAIGKPTSEKTGLYAFSEDGAFEWVHPWSTQFDGEAGEYSAVHGGRLYNFGKGGEDLGEGEPSVTINDLASLGQHVATESLGGLEQMNLLSPPTVAAGGNVYFIGQPDDSSVVLYGLSPYTLGNPAVSLKPFLHREVLSSTELPKVTRVVVSPPGPGFRAYAIVAGELWVLDAATGKRQEVGGLDIGAASDSFYDPVVTALGETDEWVIVASDKRLALLTNGVLRGHWPEEGPGTVKHPAISLGTTARESFIVTIGNGSFQRLSLHDRSSAQGCPSSDTTLDATSDLQVNDEGTTFFRNGNAVYAYDSGCKGGARPSGNWEKNLILTGCHGWRYQDQGDGTVLDCHTKLVWLKDAGCLERQSWSSGAAAKLKALNGGSLSCKGYRKGKYKNWRLPTKTDWEKMVTGECRNPAISDDLGTGCYSVQPGKARDIRKVHVSFVDVKSEYYWSGTALDGEHAWALDLYYGRFNNTTEKGNMLYVWPVRDNQP